MMYTGRCYTFTGDHALTTDESEWLMDVIAINIETTNRTGIASICGLLHAVFKPGDRSIAIPLCHVDALLEPTRSNVMVALRTEQLTVLTSVVAMLNTHPRLVDVIIRNRLESLASLQEEQCFTPGEKDLASAWSHA